MFHLTLFRLKFPRFIPNRAHKNGYLMTYCVRGFNRNVIYPSLRGTYDLNGRLLYCWRLKADRGPQ